MTQASGGKQQSVFSRWLRTGRLPSAPRPDDLELKFNPWHDPANGQFTFAGSGRYHGAGGAKPASSAPRPSGRDSPRKPRIGTAPKVETPRAKQPARSGEQAGARETTGVRPNPAAEFVGGVGEGLYGVAEETAAAVHSALTTNPVTTVGNIGRGIAGTIDAAIATEYTPARVQISRAAEAVANASPRELGRATASAVGNVALATVPGVALGKVAALRRLSEAVPRVPYDPPEIGWVKENLGRDTAWKRYNDAATGAQPGKAPALMRTMPDGSKRPVKFDGVQGEYVIDRKFAVVNRPRARAQLSRQSEVLAQHRLIGIWEVPNEAQRIAAHKLFKDVKVTNIKVRVVKP